MRILVYSGRTSDLYQSVKSYGNYRLPASLQVATLMAGDSALRRGMQPASAYAPLYYYGYRTPSSVLARVDGAQQPSQQQLPPTAVAMSRAALPDATVGARSQEYLSATSMGSAATVRSAHGFRPTAAALNGMPQQQRQQVPPPANRPASVQNAPPPVFKPSTQQPVKPPRAAPEPLSSPPPTSSQAAAAAAAAAPTQPQEAPSAPKSLTTTSTTNATTAAAVVTTSTTTTTSVVRTQAPPSASLVQVSSAPPPGAGNLDAAAGDTAPAANVTQSATSLAHEASYSSNTFEEAEDEEDTTGPSSPQHVRAVDDDDDEDVDIEDRADDARPPHDESPEADAHSRSILTTSAASENTLFDDQRPALPDADADYLEEIRLN